MSEPLKTFVGASPSRKLLTVRLRREPEIVTARRRALQLAAVLGFDHQDQIRIATATSEITRNAIVYGAGGVVEFSFEETTPAFFRITVIDKGAGIADVETILQGRFRSEYGMGVGISGTRRLMDDFRLDSILGKGTTVSFGKILPGTKAVPDFKKLAQSIEQIALEEDRGPYEELQTQNKDLLEALSAVRARETELKQREAELVRLNQELEETNRGVVALYAELDDKAAALRRADEIKSRFLSHMSHEFRTPLNSILALTGLLQRRVDGDLTPEQEKQVGFVKRAAQELFEMVNDLLDLAKVDAGKVDIHFSPVDVSKLFGALRGMMRPLALHDTVSLTFEEPRGPITLHTDEGKLAQILRNLVSNALKFTENGEVRVAVRRERDTVEFLVSDTGIGIAPADQELIFQEFAQVQSALQRKVKGTGLGLPLSRKLAELLGGKLSVKSTPGAGSTFTLTLPLGIDADIAEDSTAAGNDAVKVEMSAESILVIDDEDVARYLVNQLLRGTQYVVTEAAGGAEGLERARFDHPKLILLDLSMPDRSRFEVLRELKSDPATKDIPVVIHTSKTLTSEELDRLGGMHAALLPKKLGNREQALGVIREVLHEPYLFSVQPSASEGV